MKRVRRSPKPMPAARAAFGKRLFAVMPGNVFTSSATIRSPIHTKSVRDIPRHPSARCDVSARHPAAPERAVRTHREVLNALCHVVGDACGNDLFARAGVVLRVV